MMKGNDFRKKLWRDGLTPEQQAKALKAVDGQHDEAGISAAWNNHQEQWAAENDPHNPRMRVPD